MQIRAIFNFQLWKLQQNQLSNFKMILMIDRSNPNIFHGFLIFCWLLQNYSGYLKDHTLGSSASLQKVQTANMLQPGLITNIQMYLIYSMVVFVPHDIRVRWDCCCWRLAGEWWDPTSNSDKNISKWNWIEPLSFSCRITKFYTILWIWEAFSSSRRKLLGCVWKSQSKYEAEGQTRVKCWDSH